MRIGKITRVWFLGLLGSALGGLSAQTVSFTSRGNFAVGSAPSSVAVGDFNGDGTPDLAVANGSFASSVSVLLGIGVGAFQSPLNFPVGSSPSSVVVSDLNGDGLLDLAVANAGSNNVSVLLGTGVGTFHPGVTLAVGNNPRFIAVDDLNQDGEPDLVVANAGSNTVSVLLGTGSGFGTFQPALNFSVGRSPSSIATGDFNGDGIPDVVVANSGSNNASLLLGIGNGTFRPELNIGTGTNPVSIAAADFNGDGKLDLVTANGGFANSVSVLLGIGNGTFRQPLNFGAGSSPSFVTVADLNGDGRPDLVTANGGFAANVAVLLGFGDGTFQQALPFGTGSNPSSIAVGDFNRDGRADLAVANGGSNSVSVLLNSLAGIGPAPTITTVSAASGNVVVAPESIASIFGSGLASTTESASSRSLPTTLGGISVEVRDRAAAGRLARLFYASPSQINFELPAGIATGQVIVRILNGTRVAWSGTAQVSPIAPALFTANGSGRGVAAALGMRVDATNVQTTFPIFQCGTDGNCFSVPIELGSDAAFYLSLFGTGIRHRSSLEKVTCTIAGVAVPVLFAGPQGGFAGLDQVNIAIPPSLRGSGEADLVVTVDGQAANPVTVRVQ